MREAFELHLALPLRERLIELWHDGHIPPGADWRQEVDYHVRQADLIVLLLSPSFFASATCLHVEQHALRSYRARSGRIVPVLVRPVAWQQTWLGVLQVLPRDGRPVSVWSSQDEAWLGIVQDMLNARPSIESQIEVMVEALGRGDAMAKVEAAEALGYAGGERAVRSLLESLSDSESIVHHAAARALVRIGELAVTPLISGLASDDAQVRYRIARILGYIGDRRAVEPLIRSLQTDPDHNVRSRAAYGLGYLGDAAALPALQQAVERDRARTSWGWTVSGSAAKAIKRISARQQ